MSITNGSMTVRRYSVVGAVHDDFRIAYQEALEARAYREPSDSSWTEAYGWALTDGTTGFGVRDRWLFNQYLAVALRTDKRTIPASTFKRELNARLRVWCEANGRAKAPASVRGDIREALIAEMLAGVVPRMSLVEMCWDVAGGFVIVASTSDKPNDLIRKMFRQTFGLELEPAPTGLEERAYWSFLQWIWFAAEREGGKLSAPEIGTIDVWVNERIVLKDLAESGAKTVMTGDGVGARDGARVDFANGRTPEEVRFGLRREDREYTFSLRGSLLDLVGVKLPAQVKTGDDEKLYERMYLYDELVYCLDKIRQQWDEECTGPTWTDLTRPAMRGWVQEAFAFGEGREARLFGGDEP